MVPTAEVEPPTCDLQHMISLAIIGGSGLTSIKALDITKREIVHTPYGEPSGPLTHGVLYGKNIVFLPRHGYGHTIPPHKINYRANLWALNEAGVTNVVAIAAVGGIGVKLVVGKIVIPDQIVDYTWSRINTYFEEGLTNVIHVDFTEPYCQELRSLLINAGAGTKLALIDGGTYGAMQGPRLETAAEIDRLERDGCDMVGMTGMPEAALARELGLCYASCTIVANRAAGRGGSNISMQQIEGNLKSGQGKIWTLLKQVIKLL